MGGYLATLRVRLLAEIDQFRQQLLAGEGVMAGFVAFVVASFLAVSTAAIAAGYAVDDALDRIRISTGATGEALAGLEKDWANVFRGGPDGPAEVSVAIAELRRRTGQTGPELQALSDQVLTLSRITGSDLNATIRDSTRLFGDWAIAAQEQAPALDMLFRASQATGVGVDTLAAKMVQFGAPLRQMGFSFAESAAMLAKWEQEGVNSELVLGSLRIALAKFAAAGKDPERALRATIGRIQELGPGAKATAMAIEVFGRRAGPDMAAAILEGRFAIEGLVQTIEGGSETIQSAADDTDGLAETLARLRNMATLALAALAMPGIDWLNDQLQHLMANGDQVADVLHVVMQVMVVLASVAIGRLIPGIIASTGAWIANTAALIANAGAAGIAAAALRALRVALAFVGGPWGLAIIAVLTAVGLAFLHQGQRARQAAAEARKAAEDFRISLGTMTDAQLLATNNNLVGRLDATTSQIGAARERIARERARVEQLERSGVRVLSDANLGRGLRETADQRELRALRENLRKNEPALRAMEQHERDLRDRMRETNAEYTKRHEETEKLKQQIGSYDPADLLPPDMDKGKTALEQLQERVSGLVDVMGHLRNRNQDTSSVMAQLTAIAAAAEVRLRAMGDAATLSPEALQSYRALLDIVQQVRDATGAGRILRPEDAPIIGKFGTGEAGFSATIMRVPGVVTKATNTAKLAVGDWGARVAQTIEEVGQRLKRRGIEAARALAEEARAIALPNQVRERFSASLPGPAADFMALFERAASVRASARQAQERGQAAPPGVPALPPVPHAAGLVILSELLAGVMEELGPALQALLLPVRILGQFIGAALVPVIKLLFPVLQKLAIGATYLGQIFYNVNGAITTAVGWLVRGIGKLVNLLPGSPGAPLVTAGEAIMALGRASFQGAAEMVRAREELRGLTFDDAVSRVTDGMDRLAGTMTNMPGVFDAVYRRLLAVRRGTAPSSPTAVPVSVSGAAARTSPTQQTFQLSLAPGAVSVVQQPGEDGEGLSRRVLRYLVDELSRPGQSALKVAIMRAAQA